MNPVHRAWWRFLMGLRPLVRFLAERFPKVAPWAIRFRTVLHWLTGNLLFAATLIVGVILVVAVPGFRLTWLFWSLLAIQLVCELAFVVLADRVGWLYGWREAWLLRRRTPAGWAAVAVKTSRVQAEVGTSKEPIASARLRPVVDHPKMGWWPTIRGPLVSWWVGPPPGRSFAEFEQILEVLATNNPRVISYELDVRRATDSYARLTVAFRSVLDAPISPAPTGVDAAPWTPVIIHNDQSTTGSSAVDGEVS